MNAPDMIRALAAKMKERAILPEIEAFDAGMINYARYLERKQLLTPPQHLFFYTPDSLQKMLTKYRYTVINSIYSGKRATLDFVLFKAREAFGPIISPCQYLARVTRFNRLKIYLNLGDIMTCVAEKTKAD